MWMQKKPNYKTLSYEDIEEIAEKEIKEYNSSRNNDYAYFLNHYIKALSVVDDNRFSFFKKEQEMMPIIQKLQLDRAIMPDPLFKAKVNELVSELMNRHFAGNKLGEFSIADEIYGQQKLVVIPDEKGNSSLIRLNPTIISDIISNFIIALNDNVFSLMISEVNFNVWHNAIKSLVCFGNSVIYLDTGINYEHFIPYNIELTDITWLQNEKNIIDRVFCKKRYKKHQLHGNFDEMEIETIKSCYDDKLKYQTIELLHIVCPNPIPQAERKKYSVIGKDKDFLSLILCRDLKSKDDDFPYKIIRSSGYDKMPYLITRINRKSALANYGFPMVLEVGEAAIANSLLQSDVNDIAKIKGKPPRLEVPGFIEGGILNLNRRGINRAKIDEGKPNPISPVSVLPFVENDAIPTIQNAIQMNGLIQDDVLVRTERGRAIAGLGQMSNFDLQYLDNQAVVKMSPMSSAIEAELKKPLLEFIANYFILHEFTRLMDESKQELLSLNIQLNQLKDNLDENLAMLRKDLNTENGFNSAVELRFKEKLWMALSGKEIDLLTRWNPVDKENSDLVALKLNYFWDIVFNYDNEEWDSVNRFNIKSVKNIDLKLIPIREEAALMQDINLKIQSISQLLQVSQIDPETAKVRINIDQFYSDIRKIPMMKNVIRDDVTSMQLRQQMAQMRQQMEQQAQAQQQNPQQQTNEGQQM